MTTNRQPGDFEQLTNILRDELEIVEDDPQTDLTPHDLSSLRTAISKLDRGITNLTQGEKAMVEFALEDVGELTRFAGSQAGFRDQNIPDAPEDVNIPREVEAEQRDLGQQAALQGLALGIRPRPQPEDITPEEIQRFFEQENDNQP